MDTPAISATTGPSPRNFRWALQPPPWRRAEVKAAQAQLSAHRVSKRNLSRKETLLLRTGIGVGELGHAKGQESGTGRAQGRGAGGTEQRG